MILEVDDQGRIERIVVIGNAGEKTIDGRTFIGGSRLNTQGYEEIWFDKAVWDVTSIPNPDGIETYRLTRKAS